MAAMVPGFVSCAQQSSEKKIENELANGSAKDLSKYSHATFAAGCFWHEEALFESVKGVEEAISGYAGGTAKDPHYDMIENGNT